MRRYRITGPANRDLASILATSTKPWGPVAQRRYAGLLVAAFRKAAFDPNGTATRDRSEIAPGLRSLHTRSARADTESARADTHAPVSAPVHVIYFRVVDDAAIDIVRVLHERMEPRRHISR
jgi:toxin ParE1/3/4